MKADQLCTSNLMLRRDCNLANCAAKNAPCSGASKHDKSPYPVLMPKPWKRRYEFALCLDHLRAIVWIDVSIRPG